MKAIIVLILASISSGFLGSREPIAQSGEVEVRLSTDRLQYEPGQLIRAKVEFKNVSNHTILVGRELSLIANWPFSIWLRLVNADGKLAQPIHGAYVDPPPKPDLSLRNGVLRWWVALDPDCYYGKEMNFQLESIAPGHYELRGEYYSAGLATKVDLAPEGEREAKRIPAFAGKIVLTPVTIEVLPGTND